MRIRNVLVLAIAVGCAAVVAQQPKLVVHASFDGDCSLQTGGAGKLVAGEFVDGRDGQAIRGTEEGKSAAEIPMDGVSAQEGTLMFWFRPDRANPEERQNRVRWTPLTAGNEAGPLVNIAQLYHQAMIEARNPWDGKHRGGARAVYSHLIPGKWYHLAYTWNKADNDVCFWLFGKAQSDTLGKWNDLTHAEEGWGEALQVGSVAGSIDDLRIYDRQMTGQQIGAAGDYGRGECMYDEGRVRYDTRLDVDGLKGDLVIDETFDEPWQDNWVLEGPGIITQRDGRLRMREPDPDAEGANHIVLWNKMPHPKDFVAQWEFTPNDVSGLCIVFFCAKGRNGESIFDPSLAERDGTFRGYILGDINCYHISYFRNTCGRSPNVATRKNHGFYRVACGYDYVPLEAGVTSTITLLKRGAHIQFAVDGRVCIDWVDDGVSYGPVWGAGRIGLRQMMTTDAWYDNFRVWAAE